MSARGAFTLTPEEGRVYKNLFQAADEEGKGVISGTSAVKFFQKSGLPPQVLRQIWTIADSENQGYLTPKSFSIAVKLIALAQNGQAPDQALINADAPLPQFSGTLIEPFLISNEDQEKYKRIFFAENLTNGILEGEKAKEIFVKSGLPVEKLLKIWQLADTKGRGKLDLTEFIIAMHLIRNVMNGQIITLPSSLPPGFYDHAAGTKSDTPIPSSPSPFITSPRLTSSTTSNYLSNDVLRKTSLPSPFVVTSSEEIWDVTAQEKASFDRHFTNIDIPNRGYITGEEAAKFFMASELPPEVLAQIWDLADITKSGNLNRDEFAVAMHLIIKKKAGAPLPATLPSTLIPPSLRSLFARPTGPGIHSRSSTSLSDGDLFDLSPAPSTNNVVFQKTASNEFDLLGDTDIDTKLALETSEVRNLQSNITSITNAKNELEKQGTILESSLTSLTNQKHEVTARLTQIRALYEAEAKKVQEIRNNYQKEHQAMEEVKAELARAEGSLATLQLEKDQLQSSISRDLEEIQTLKKNIRLVEEETSATKAQIEKLKKDGRQQKGLLAINRKQLAAVETEKGKSIKELQNIQDGPDRQENDSLNNEIFLPQAVNQSSTDLVHQSNVSEKVLHSSLLSLDNEVKRTTSDASLSSTQSTASVKSTPTFIPDEQITASVASSKPTEFEDIFNSPAPTEIPSTLGMSEISDSPHPLDRSINNNATVGHDGSNQPFSNAQESTNSLGEGQLEQLSSANPFSIKQDVSEASQEKQETFEQTVSIKDEKKPEPFPSADQFTFSSSIKTSGKSYIDSAFGPPSKDPDTFATDYPPIEEIEKSVVGFEDDFASFVPAAEKKLDENKGAEVLGKENINTPNVEDKPLNSRGDEFKKEFEVGKDEIQETHTISEPLDFVTNTGESDPKLNFKSKDDFEATFFELAESKETSEPGIAVQTSKAAPASSKDDFDAIFSDLTEAKITNNINVEIPDSDFDVEEFDPTFGTPPVKPAFGVSTAGSNVSVSSAQNIGATSSNDLEKAFGLPLNGNSNFDSPSSKQDLDVIFGGSSSDPIKNVTGFEDTFSEFAELPPSKPKADDDGDGDSEHVKRILELGFTREQAVNALELHDYRIESAIGYLVDNTG